MIRLCIFIADLLFTFVLEKNYKNKLKYGHQFNRISTNPFYRPIFKKGWMKFVRNEILC